MQLIINFTNILQHLCPYYTHAKVKKNKKYITMPKLRPFEHKGDFPNLETFNIYKQHLPDWANYDSKLSEKCHMS